MKKKNKKRIRIETEIKPKLALVSLGKATYVFLDGKCIIEGLLDVEYSAKDEKGDLRPTLDMKLDIQRFSFENGQTLESFIKEVEKEREFLSGIKSTIKKD